MFFFFFLQRQNFRVFFHGKRYQKYILANNQTVTQLPQFLLPALKQTEAAIKASIPFRISSTISSMKIGTFHGLLYWARAISTTIMRFCIVLYTYVEKIRLKGSLLFRGGKKKNHQVNEATRLKT